MPNVSEKFLKNMPGPYYVDTSCTDCDLCRAIAPAIFQRDGDTGNSYVYRQPETAAELALAEEARASCPTETIGADGGLANGM
jgi:ferredoxin